MSGEAGKNPLRRQYDVERYDRGADIYYGNKKRITARKRKKKAEVRK